VLSVLKQLLRRYGFRCTRAEEIPPKAECAPDASPAQLPERSDKMSTDVVKNDGFDIEPSDRIIRGGLLKCNDGRWTHDGEAIGGEQCFLVVGTTECVQRWADGKPVETITDKPLPDVDALNAAVPEEDWEEGIAGPRPPWQRQRAVYFIRPSDGATFTYVSGTIGGRIAVETLADRVTTMRMLRGESVLPLVSLGSKVMKTRFGQRIRPEFVIKDWRRVGGNAHQAIEHKAEVGTPVKSPTVAEELNDAVSF
jgi:hypothetical protein